jgi:dual specificity tyrosine-phosphorylation-regulated kinase 2/3/4
LPYPKNSLKPNRSLLSFDLIFGSKDKKFIDFIKKCLEWDPKKRITPKEALLHEWILDEIPENIR